VRPAAHRLRRGLALRCGEDAIVCCRTLLPGFGYMLKCLAGAGQI